MDEKQRMIERQRREFDPEKYGSVDDMVRRSSESIRRGVDRKREISDKHHLDTQKFRRYNP